MGVEHCTGLCWPSAQELILSTEGSVLAIYMLERCLVQWPSYWQFGVCIWISM